jgi:dipeptidyl aminopeptidase/acylaminoacyl peptidase
MRAYPPEDSESKAADLLVRELATGTTSNFGNVSDFAWAEVGSLLAMTIETESGTGNGVHFYDPEQGTLRVLESSTSVYRALSWREDARDLAVLRSQEDEGFEEDTHVVLAWSDVGTGRESHRAFDPAAAARFPEGMRIVEHKAPEWAEEGASIFFGIRPRERAEEVDSAEVDSTSTQEEEVSDVQIWHAKDFRIIPMQKAQEERDLERSILCAWHFDGDRFVQLGTNLMETVDLLEGNRYATETWGEPYRFETMFGREYFDVYLINAATGERTKVLERIRHLLGGSATGRYLLYFKARDYWTYDLNTGQHLNLTDDVPTVFAYDEVEYDYPVQQYHVWRLTPDGSTAERLTNGADEEVRHRYVRLDDEAESINRDEYLYLYLYGEQNKKGGYARMRLGRPPERLVFENKRITSLARADSADVFLYIKQSFDDSPDAFVAGPSLRDARQVTELNPFQGDFAWGRSELVDFVSATGRPLQAALLYPAGYDPSRQYPMIVYTYEILSPRVHVYVVPSERSYYNFSVFTSQGYFVLLPDIVYRDRDPGRSAVEAVVPAVQAIVDRGLVDPERVGLVGHSWGGYQATYIPTQTDIFAASVAGAPLTNFLSMMGAIHWRPGLPETGHWETGQARMEVPFWEDFDAHVRNSPAAFVHELNTPMLMMFGDADGTVDWHQGIEFYNFARRAGKDDFVMLVYPGEDHGLRQKENQIDYHQRILQWFGHYLKGEAAPKWMTEGVSHLERKRKLEER